MDLPTQNEQNLRDLAKLLQEYRPLWEQRPFVQLPVPWEKDWPHLSGALRSLSVEELAKYENDPLSIPALQDVCGELLSQLGRYSQWGSFDGDSSGGRNVGTEPKRPDRVDARKWTQVVRFVQAVGDHVPPEVERWVDWCAGKGHLGRILSEKTGLPVTCVEIDGGLVSTGKLEVERSGANVSFAHADVLSDPTGHLLDEKTGVVALHACGHLNAQLLQLAVGHGLAFIALVPCCYQRIDGMLFTPLSNAGRAVDLSLTRHQLRIAALDEVTTSEKKRQHRQRENAFRLGTDLLIREASGVDAYTPLGKISPDTIRGSFEQFAHKSARKVNAPLPVGVSWDRAEAAGWDRFHTVSVLSVARRLFRRAIETWLFLDRVCFLEEHDYHVIVGTFCQREVTPRNLMLLGRARPSSGNPT